MVILYSFSCRESGRGLAVRVVSSSIDDIFALRLFFWLRQRTGFFKQCFFFLRGSIFPRGLRGMLASGPPFFFLIAFRRVWLSEYGACGVALLVGADVTSAVHL